ncbi:MAG TPA: membrane protein insertase YidC [Vicinamibacterales bacterium]|nr:membrane protein insertase YidC [Vicinamibacterales bacterium]
MERKVLLAVILSFIVLYGWQALFPPPPPPEAQPAARPGGAERAVPPAPRTPEQAIPAEPTPVNVESQPVVAAAGEQDVVFENSAVRAVFSNRGAVLESWRLKNYRDESGQPLELVPHALTDATRPFSLQMEDAGVAGILAQALFKPSADSVQAETSPGSLAFEYGDASGLRARKEFTIRPDAPYIIEFSVDVSRGETSLNPTIRWGPALGTGIVGSGMTYNPAPQPVFYRDGDVTRVSFGSIAEQRVQEGQFGFVGVEDHYFLSALLPHQAARVEYEPVPVPVPGSDKGLQFVDWSARFAAPPRDARFFFGPKDYDVLYAISPDLTRAIDFGMFDWLVVPLLRSLKWVNGYIGNYGWSIIVLTVIINLVMFPLRHKSVVSMRRMQELQPEVKAIQERYSKLKVSDPARSKMNAELMNLYRERGVNPASGCVPMLLTFPVLLAFYSMLVVAIELRGAPFIGWIRDLSAHDPYFVTPVLMGISQFVQTKMTPSTADPVQQKMMLFMPIMFTAMLMWAPSGLVLYWTASNIWAIGQQVVTNRLIGPSPQHAVRPPAERRLKNAGAGRSAQAAKERK